VSGLADVVAVVCGLAMGGVTGYAVGRAVVGSRRRFWLAAGVGFLGCVVADVMGARFGLSWATVGSLGVLAGWLTALKYGGIAEVRVWEPRSVAADADPGASVDPDATAPAPDDAGAGRTGDA